jgi:integrase
MLSKRFSLLFYLKKPRNFVKGKEPIYMRVTIDNIRFELSTQRQCESSRWNVAAGRALGTKEEAKSLNTYLDSLQSKVYEAHRRLLDSYEDITADALKRQLSGARERHKSVVEVFEEHNSQLRQLVGREFSASTALRYRTTLSHLKNFISWKYEVPDLEIKRLDYEFISDFSFWFRSVRNCNHNSTTKYLTNFKRIVLSCVKKGWLQRDPFLGFDLSKKEVERPYLTRIEFERITSKEFATDRLNVVRDIFVFSCFTGLAYIDVQKLKRSQIVIGVDGAKWIFTHRQKSKEATRFPLLPSSLQIIERYKDDLKCMNEGKLLPVLSNQKMNSYLKEIAAVCEINKVLTFHIARHTFATTVTLSNGVPIESVSKMLGHRNLRTTQHYAKILDH